MKNIVFPAILLVICTSMLYGQSSTKNRFYVEVEPLQFINEGWSLVGHYAVSNRLQIGSNAFTQVLPEGLHDFAFDISGNTELSFAQDFGLNVSIRYFLLNRATPEGWVVSLPIGWETWTISDEEPGSRQEYAFWYLSPRIGYLWYPFKRKQFYLLGEAIAIIPISTDEDVQFGESTARIRPLVPLPSIGIGFAF